MSFATYYIRFLRKEVARLLANAVRWVSHLDMPPLNDVLFLPFRSLPIMNEQHLRHMLHLVLVKGCDSFGRHCHASLAHRTQPQHVAMEWRAFPPFQLDSHNE
jgi:hypothetical protein